MILIFYFLRGADFCKSDLCVRGAYPPRGTAIPNCVVGERIIKTSADKKQTKSRQKADKNM